LLLFEEMASDHISAFLKGVIEHVLHDDLILTLRFVELFGWFAGLLFLLLAFPLALLVPVFFVSAGQLSSTVEGGDE
jgi:hypothetical protein